MNTNDESAGSSAEVCPTCDDAKFKELYAKELEAVRETQEELRQSTVRSSEDLTMIVSAGETDPIPSLASDPRVVAFAQALADDYQLMRTAEERKVAVKDISDILTKLISAFTSSLQAQCADKDREIERLKSREEILKTAQLACNEAMADSVKQYERLQILAEERGNAWKFEHRRYQEAQRRVADVTKDLAKVCAEARDYCAERDHALTAQKQAEERLAAVHKHHDESLESDSPFASCNCHTKTPDIQYHKPGCKYRLIMERDELRGWSKEVRERLAEVERALVQARCYHHGECNEFLGKGRCNCFVMSVGVKDAHKYDTLVKQLRTALAAAQADVKLLAWLIARAKAPNWDRDWPQVWKLDVCLNASNHEGEEPDFKTVATRWMEQKGAE